MLPVMIERKYIYLAIISITVIIALVMATVYYDYQEYKDTVKARVDFHLADGVISFYCEIADDYQERQQGLMNVESLDQDAGLLFIFETPRDASFWMKDHLIPLDIIFINETGYVVNVLEADPEPDVPDDLLTRYESDGPVRWVLEINQGICATEGIGPGTQIGIDDY